MNPKHLVPGFMPGLQRCDSLHRDANTSQHSENGKGCLRSVRKTVLSSWVWGNPGMFPDHTLRTAVPKPHYKDCLSETQSVSALF